MKNKFTLLLFLFLSPVIFSQEKKNPTKDVPFSIIEKVPVYPGCTGEDNEILKKCMSKKIGEHIAKKFKTSIAKKLKLKPGIQRINVQFTINKNGDVVNIHAKASHPKLEKEAIRVVKSLPRMEPGMQKGKAVGVFYALPIKFKI